MESRDYCSGRIERNKIRRKREGGVCRKVGSTSTTNMHVGIVCSHRCELQPAHGAGSNVSDLHLN